MMINFKVEIEKYKPVCNLCKDRLQKYVKALHKFCDYLASELCCSPEEVYLDRIYTVRHGDKVLAYKPIDGKLIDGYLKRQVNNGYSCLSTATHALKNFFRYLKNNHNYPNVVATMEFKLSDYSPEANDIRILSRHELLRFLHSMVTHSENLIRDAVLFSLLLSTGCRISEILNLKVSDINVDDEMIFLEKTKSKVQRVVVLREGFGKALQAYFRMNDLKQHDFLFVNENYKSAPMSKSNLDEMFKNYLELANLPAMRLHSIRHSFATHMRDVGVDLLTIMELLGHNKLQSTLNYTQPHYTRNAKIRIKEHDEFYNKLRVVLKKTTQ